MESTVTGKALRSIRLALSLTLPEFADQLGISVAELDAFERGDIMLDMQRLSRGLERLQPGSTAASQLLPRPRTSAADHGADQH